MRHEVLLLGEVHQGTPSSEFTKAAAIRKMKAAGADAVRIDGQHPGAALPRHSNPARRAFCNSLLIKAVVVMCGGVAAACGTGHPAAGGGDVDGGAAVDVALAADVSAVQDAVAAGVCPGPQKPTADTYTGDVPYPAAPLCTRPPPKFFKGAPPPAKTIDFEVGVVRPPAGATPTADTPGIFEPYSDGAWVSMDHGPQGGFHVWLALKLAFASPDPQLKVQLEATLLSGCSEIGHTVAPVVYPKLQAGGASYQLGSAGVPGVYVVFDEGGDVKSSSSKAYCNRWYDLYVAVREMKSGKWGDRAVRIRTYDTQ